MSDPASSESIVFLDRDTLDPGDLDFTGLESLGPLSSFPVTTPEEVAERIASASIVLTNKVVIDAAAMEAAPGLKLIQIAATGVNNVDLDAAKEQGVAVCNVSGYSTPSVAQHVFALLLNLATQTHRYDAERTQWPESPHFTRLTHPVTELHGKTLGVAGLGAIGSEVAAIGEALGMKAIGLARKNGKGAAPGDGRPRLDRESFFREADAVTLHCPLTPETRHLVNRTTLALMKPTAFLINTGRGDLVDEEALVEALRSGAIAGAGLDVLSVEPPAVDHPLLDPSLTNLLVTPHTAWSSREARTRLLEGIVENIKALRKGERLNRVD